MTVDEKVFNVTFIDTTFNVEMEKMVNQLDEAIGVHGATPEVDPDGIFYIVVRYYG